MRMKLLLVTILILLGIGVIVLKNTGPVATALRSCYEWADNEFTKDRLDSEAYGWSDEKLCKENSKTLQSLDYCVLNIGLDLDRTEKEVKKTFDFMTFMRPNIKDTNERKAAHNRSCIEYSETLLKLRVVQ
ncbi:MAG: hypothetical protein ACOZAO_02625 [Patescibacteria group bacterium]